MSDGPRPGLGVRVARALIAGAAWLVPRGRRAAWREEWASEVWHHLHRGPGSDPGAQVRLVARCAGAWPHALWIRGEEWNVDSIWQDLRFAVRTLAKRPGFTAVAVATLTLGIGANTAVFSVVDAVVLNPLPIPNADRLLWMWGRTYDGHPIASVSPPDFRDYEAGTTAVFEEFAAYSSFSNRVVYADGDRPEELLMRLSTANLLKALGVEPVLGRSFTRDETTAASSDAVMISEGAWERLYASDPEVVGRTLRLDGEAYTIVGVTPRDMVLQAGVDVWGPLVFGHDDYQSRAGHFLRPIALLRPEITRERAQEALDAISARLEVAYPETNQGWYPPLQPLQDVVLGNTRPALLVMLGAVGLVLLIACANVGNLLLARAGERRGELAVRAALGASGGRITRQLVVESLLLALVAGAAGLAVAAGGIAALRGLGGANVPRLDEVAMNGRVLGLTLAVTTLVGVAFGLFPSVALGKGRLAAAMGGSGRGRGARRGGRVRQGLVVGEVALSFVFLTGAVLLMRSFATLSAVDPGFDERDVLTIPMTFTPRNAETGAEVRSVQERILTRVAALPDVRDAAFADLLPMSGNGGDTYVYAADRPPEQVRRIENTAERRAATAGYFEALGARVVRGRTFDASDTPESEGVVVINESLARRFFPDEDPIGRDLVIALDSLTHFRVVGVVADMRQYSLGQPARAEFHVSMRQVTARGVTLVVKGARGPVSVAAVRDAVWEVDPTQPLARATTMEEYVGRSLAAGRFQTVLLSVFAGLAVLLASVGLYGVLAQTVVERRHEIGVRLAMGAQRGWVTAMIVRQGVAVAAVGLGMGGVAALGATRLLDALLYGVGARDPVAFGLTPLLLVAVVLVASWLPARRASRTDPARSLRAE